MPPCAIPARGISRTIQGEQLKYPPPGLIWHIKCIYKRYLWGVCLAGYQCRSLNMSKSSKLKSLKAEVKLRKKKVARQEAKLKQAKKALKKAA